MSDMEGLAESTVRVAMQLPEAVVHLNVDLAKTDIPRTLEHIDRIQGMLVALRSSLLLFRPQNAQSQ